MIRTFQDKRVALIGPAPHVAEIDQKRALQSMDLICRVNYALPVPERVARTTTNRCDVLYVHEKIKPHDGWHRCREIRMRADRLWAGMESGDLSSFKGWREKLVVTHPRHAWDLFFDVGSRLNTGFSAMSDIISEGPAELYITGFTFHQGAGVYDPDYAQRVGSAQRQRRIVESNGRVDGHRPLSQLDYFINNIYGLPNVEVDDELRRVVTGRMAAHQASREMV